MRVDPQIIPASAKGDREFMAQLRHLDDIIEQRMESHKNFYAEARQRFINAYDQYGHSWRKRDLKRESREEMIDAFLWGQAMTSMKEKNL